jgi:hypothetical protein
LWTSAVGALDAHGEVLHKLRQLDHDPILPDPNQPGLCLTAEIVASPALAAGARPA